MDLLKYFVNNPKSLLILTVSIAVYLIDLIIDEVQNLSVYIL